MKCASFFTGIGGIDIGFEKAGFKTIFANELDPFAAKTINANFEFHLENSDINSLKSKELPDFDIMLAGFPCQAFSIAGRRQGFNDDKGRGNLFFKLEEIFRAKKPDVILLENVKNLVTHDDGNTLAVILEKLKAHKYHVKYKVLNACKYGNIPQNRERIYIVCFKDSKACDRFNFPSEIPLTKTIMDMLEPEETIPERFYYSEKSALYPALVNEVKNADTVYQWRRKYVRANKSNLCPTLTANMGTGGHNVPLINVQGKPNTIRKLTPRECFNFQGFPADFVLPDDVSVSNLYKQAGNSVVVPVIERIANEIKKALQL